MKKLFIMLANGIVGMGGGQMYVRNKTLYMQDKGYDPIVYSGHTGKIIIDELKQFESKIMPIFLSTPLVYGKQTVENTIAIIEADCREYDDVIIESGIAPIALWGELIAERIKGKHMVHLLDERNDLLAPEGYLDFFGLNIRDVNCLELITSR